MSGLIGPIIITSRIHTDVSRHNGAVGCDIDNEIILLVNMFDENDSRYKYSTHMHYSIIIYINNLYKLN